MLDIMVKFQAQWRPGDPTPGVCHRMPGVHIEEPLCRQHPGGVEDHRTPGRPTMDVRRGVEQDDSKFMPRSLEGMGDL